MSMQNWWRMCWWWLHSQTESSPHLAHTSLVQQEEQVWSPVEHFCCGRYWRKWRGFPWCCWQDWYGLPWLQDCYWLRISSCPATNEAGPWEESGHAASWSPHSSYGLSPSSLLPRHPRSQQSIISLLSLSRKNVISFFLLFFSASNCCYYQGRCPDRERHRVGYQLEHGLYGFRLRMWSLKITSFFSPNDK